jgi:hypothetical protein
MSTLELVLNNVGGRKLFLLSEQGAITNAQDTLKVERNKAVYHKLFLLSV